MKSIKIILLSFVFFSLVMFPGCSKPKFNPYKHMSRIVTVTSSEQFEHDRKELLAHISPELQPEFIESLSTDIYDTQYSLTEHTILTEETPQYTKILADYYCTSCMGEYVIVAYFEYQNDILVDYSIQTIDRLGKFII